MTDLSNKFLKTITHITTNSNLVQKGGVFTAIKGTKNDGHKFIQQAINKGAKYIICEKIPHQYKNSKSLIQVPDSRLTYAIIQETLHNFPSKKLQLIGITGTNGKTTTTHILQNLLGSQCASISTLGIKFKEIKKASPLTTPDAAIIQQELANMTKEQYKECVIETSAHSLTQKRLGSTKFDYTIFTNLSQDHLDYYKNLKDYFEAKSLLFSQHLNPFGIAIINGDDTYGQALCKRLERSKFISFGQQDHNDAQIIIKPSLLSIKFHKKIHHFKHNFIGEYNAYNLSAAILVASLKNISISSIQKKLLSLEPCTGRLQKIPNHNIFIDYAHTPDALEKSLNALKKNKLTVIFGCGGNRDIKKRALMGKIAEKYADKIILTDDNPRQEKPEKIVADILNGINNKNKVEVIHNRYQAIAYAIEKYDSKTTLLIAGKGHESQQTYKDKTLPFNDYDVTMQILNDS